MSAVVDSPTAPSPAILDHALAVSANDVAAMLGISVAHFFALRKANKFGPSPVRLGRSVRFRVAEVSAWLDAGCPSRQRWAAMNQQAKHAAQEVGK